MYFRAFHVVTLHFLLLFSLILTDSYYANTVEYIVNGNAKCIFNFVTPINCF